MSLKELMEDDLDTFLNTDEFAVDALFDGSPIKVLYDDIQEDTFNIQLVTCKESDVVGITSSSTLVVNGVNYTTSSWVPKDGMIEIILNKA